MQRVVVVVVGGCRMRGALLAAIFAASTLLATANGQDEDGTQVVCIHERDKTWKEGSHSIINHKQKVDRKPVYFGTARVKEEINSLVIKKALKMANSVKGFAKERALDCVSSPPRPEDEGSRNLGPVVSRNSDVCRADDTHNQNQPL